MGNGNPLTNPLAAFLLVISIAAGIMAVSTYVRSRRHLEPAAITQAIFQVFGYLLIALPAFTSAFIITAVWKNDASFAIVQIAVAAFALLGLVLVITGRRREAPARVELGRLPSRSHP